MKVRIVLSPICIVAVIFFFLVQFETQAAYAWSKSSPRTAQNIFPSVDITPDGSQLVVASWNDGVYLSTNGGAAWSKKSPAGIGVSMGWNSAGISDSGAVIAATAWNNYLYLSKDSGATWSKKSPAGTGVTKGWNSSSVNSAGTIITSCAFNDYLYVSVDGGTNWSKKSPAGTGITKGWNSTAINGAGTVIATSAFNDYIYVSVDSGATWSKKSPAGTGITKGWNSVAVNDAGTVLVAVAYNDYVYVSVDSGATWSKKSPAGAVKGWKSVAVSKSGAQMVVSAENDYIYTSADSGATWTKNNPSGGTVGLQWQSVTISGGGTKIAAAANGSYVYYSVSDSIGWTVTFVPGEGGTIEGDSLQTILNGKDCTAVTAVPDDGFSFVNWTGSMSSTDNPLTVTGVTKDMTISANFASDNASPVINLASLKFRAAHLDKILRNPGCSQQSSVVPVETLAITAVFEAGENSSFPVIDDDSTFSMSIGGWNSGVLTLSQAVRKKLGSATGYANFAIAQTTDGAVFRETLILKWTADNTITVILNVRSCGTMLGCVTPANFNYVPGTNKIAGAIQDASFSFAGLEWKQADMTIEYNGKARSRKTNLLQLQSWDVSGAAK